MPSPLVRYEVRDRIARIVLERPPVNALSLEMIRAVVAGFRQAAKDDSARAVILMSAVPGRFSAGLDLDVLSGEPTKARAFLEELYIGLYDAQYNLGKPSIAAVGGTARGGGMTMAVSCDVILASDGATFGYPEIDAGVLPAIHFAHLPRIIGRHRAFELLFSGRAFDAVEAKELGLVSHICEEGAFERKATLLAETFAGKSAAVLRHARAAFMRQNDLDYRRAIAAAVEDFCNGIALPDAREGLRAFIEKRKPTWSST